MLIIMKWLFSPVNAQWHVLSYVGGFFVGCCGNCRASAFQVPTNKYLQRSPPTVVLTQGPHTPPISRGSPTGNYWSGERPEETWEICFQVKAPQCLCDLNSGCLDLLCKGVVNIMTHLALVFGTVAHSAPSVTSGFSPEHSGRPQGVCPSHSSPHCGFLLGALTYLCLLGLPQWLR